MNKRRIALVLGVLAVAIVSLSIAVGAQDTSGTAEADNTAPDYQIDDQAQAQIGDLQQTVTAAGSLDPARRVTLSFQASAPVVDILVEEGQRVSAGDVLAQVDNRDLMERIDDIALQVALEQVDLDDITGPATAEDIAAAEAAVQAARLAMGTGVALTGADSIAAEIDRLNAELQANQLWQTQMNRDNNPPSLDGAWLAVLFTEEGSAEREDALEDYYLAEAQLTINDNAIVSQATGVEVARDIAEAEQSRPTTTGGSSSAQQQLVQAQIQLDNLVGDPDEIAMALAEIDLAIAELDLDFVEIQAEEALLVAPFDGVVAEVNVALGEVPPQNAAVMIDTSSFELVVGVDEIDVTQLRVGQAVEIELDALPQAEVTGVIEHIALTSTVRSGVTTYDVRIRLDETDALVRAGMTATASVVITDASDVVLIPSQFVRQAEQLGASVVVVQASDGTLEVRRVTTGASNAGTTAISDGLEAGETVVALSQSELQRFVRDQFRSGQLDIQGLRNGS